MSPSQHILERLRLGRHGALLGAGSPVLPDSLGALVVDCAASHPLLEHVRALAEQLRRPHRARAFTDRSRLGLRRHLTGEEFGAVELAPYVEAFDRLAAPGQPGRALVLQNVELADPASLEVLTALLDAHRLSVPTLFCFGEVHPRGPAATLFDALLRSEGPRAVVEFDHKPAKRPRPAEPEPDFTPEGLPPEQLVLLRAAATMGSDFESKPLARLLGLDELEVLQRLQQARDSGVPIADRGRGRFRLPAGVCQTLASGVLPSLAKAWHERLAELFSDTSRVVPDLEVADTESEATLTPKAGPMSPFETTSAKPESRAEELLVSEGARRAPNEPGQDREWNAALDRWKPVTPPKRSVHEFIDEPRAAAHAKRAGNLALAAEKYTRAAQRAARAGSHVVAADYAERALELLGELPTSDDQRLWTASALIALGQARWRGAGDGASLGQVLKILDESKRLLTPQDPLALRAELSTLVANVCYDLGTPEALERALLELGTTAKELLAAGEPLEAARLLNDEAALWVRIGDPVRAHYLLSRSREVFRRVIATYPPASHELAQTDHMLARLLLHAKPRPGREQDALRLGIEHAKNAEQALHDQGDLRGEARVWETLGRLEMRADHLEQAARHFDDAIVQQQELGDHVGLARSAGALAELLSRRGESARALERLSESIRNNLATGSRGGLRFNLESLQKLSSELPLELAGTARELEEQLLERLGGS